VVAVLRLGASEQGITEILALAEHVTSIAAAASGLRLRPDVPAEPSGPRTELVDLAAAAPTEAEGTLSEVAAWSATALGMSRAPAFWRAIARKPRLLEAMWAKHRLVLGEAQLASDLKAAVALGVAMNAHSQYWSGYFDELGRRSYGFDDETVVEIAGAVVHFKAFNTIAHGMMLEAPHVDIAAEDFPPETRPAEQSSARR
jgi:hypothetical protein